MGPTIRACQVTQTLEGHLIPWEDGRGHITEEQLREHVVTVCTYGDTAEEVVVHLQRLLAARRQHICASLLASQTRCSYLEIGAMRVEAIDVWDELWDAFRATFFPLGGYLIERTAPFKK